MRPTGSASRRQIAAMKRPALCAIERAVIVDQRERQNQPGDQLAVMFDHAASGARYARHPPSVGTNSSFGIRNVVISHGMVDLRQCGDAGARAYGILEFAGDERQGMDNGARHRSIRWARPVIRQRWLRAWPAGTRFEPESSDARKYAPVQHAVARDHSKWCADHHRARRKPSPIWFR